MFLVRRGLGDYMRMRVDRARRGRCDDGIFGGEWRETQNGENHCSGDRSEFIDFLFFLPKTKQTAGKGMNLVGRLGSLYRGTLPAGTCIYSAIAKALVILLPVLQDEGSPTTTTKNQNTQSGTLTT